VEDIADTLSANALAFEYYRLPDDLAGASARRVRPIRATDALLNATTLIDDVAASPPFSDEDLAGIARPSLAVYGEHTDLATSARRLGAAVPGCRLEIVPGVAHSVLRDETSAVVDLLLQWLCLPMTSGGSQPWRPGVPFAEGLLPPRTPPLASVHGGVEE